MIRLAKSEDLLQIQSVYTAARRFMAANGNPHQWNAHYPSNELLLQDIQLRQLYVEETDGAINGVFVLALGDDPTYGSIEDGAWLSETPYGTIHRIASNGTTPGFFGRCVAFCRERIRHLRIDTHRDNSVMQHLLEQAGFQYCGIIYLASGDPRLAYEITE